MSESPFSFRLSGMSTPLTWQEGPMPRAAKHLGRTAMDKAFCQRGANTFVLESFQSTEQSCSFLSFDVGSPLKMTMLYPSPTYELSLLLEGRLFSRLNTGRLKNWYPAKSGTYTLLSSPIIKREIRLQKGIIRIVLVRNTTGIAGVEKFREKISPVLFLSLSTVMKTAGQKPIDQQNMNSSIAALLNLAREDKPCSLKIPYTLEDVENTYRSGLGIKKYMEEKGILHRQFRKSGVEKNTYYTLFKDMFGSSPSVYLNNIRLTTAKKELLMGNVKSLSQLSLMLGFPSVSGFTSSYIQYFGHHPSKDFIN